MFIISRNCSRNSMACRREHIDAHSNTLEQTEREAWGVHIKDILFWNDLNLCYAQGSHLPVFVSVE